MRRLLVVVALLALMIGVETLQAPSLPSAHDPLTLATIGFVLLASFTLAESGAALRLPRVTGYILGGALLGPSAINLLDAGVVGEMRMFNTLALGLIAISAGLELDVHQIAKVWRTLVATIAFKVVFLSVLVGGGLVLFERGYPSLGLSSQQQVYAMALVFAALAIGTSPSVTLAVLSELRAKGRPADLFLGAAVLKDLVVVVALAVAVALAKPLLEAQAASGSGGLVLVAIELGASILAGSLLGVLLVAYVRFVKAEMLLFVAAMILVGAELSRALHLELLLVFIVAGFVVRNFSKYGHELMGPVSLVSLPVFVVFFTNAGASIDIAKMLGLLPIALTLSALRAFGLWSAARLGGRVGGEAEPIRRHAWLGYIPQAGVTLGLVALAVQQLPELGEEIAGLGMAVVAVNLLVGPLTLRVALGKLGVGATPVAGRSPSTRSPSERRAESQAEPAGAEGSDALLDSWARELGPSQLSSEISSLWLDLLEVVAWHRRELAERAAERMAPPLSSALSAGRSEHGLEHARAVVGAIAWPPATEVSELARTAFHRMRERLCALPSKVLDPLDPSQLGLRPGDSLWVELGRRRRRIAMAFSKRARQRRVSLQMAARVALEARLAGWASQQLAEYAHLRVALMHTLERYLHGQCTGPEALAEVERLLGSWSLRAEDAARNASSAGTTELVATCRQADLPGADAGRLRLSRHTARIAEHVNTFERHPAPWQRILDDLDCELQLEFELAQADAAFLAAFSEETSTPVERAAARVDQALAAAERGLKGLASQPVAGAAPIALAESVWRDQLDRGLIGELEEEVARLRAASPLQRLALQLRRVAARLPESIDVPWSEVEPADLADPAGVRFRKLAPRSIASEQLVDRLLPRLEEQLQSVAAGLDTALEALHEIHSMTSQALVQSDAALLQRTLERSVAARARLAALRQQFTAETAASVEQAFSAVAARLSHRGQRSWQEETTALSRSWLALDSLASRWRRRLERWMRWLVSTVIRVGDFELARHFRERISRGARDGTTVASSIRSLRELPHVPASYAKLFSPQPVREPRLFCVRQIELRTVLEAERLSLEGQPSSVLIVGAHGSGRTSLLNIAQLELRAPRVLRPQPGQAQRRGELLRALALELGCRPDPDALRAALAQVHTTVLIDDLEHWFEPTLAGAERLCEFVRLVSATRATACFVVALPTVAFQIFRELVPLQTAFTRHVQLAPIGSAELRQLIEARHRSSGMPLDFHSELGLRWLRRLGSGREAALFFRLLRRMTNGNLALALRVFLSSADVVEGGVRVRTEHPLSVGLSFLEQLETQQLAALNQALRFGGVGERCLEGASALTSEPELHLAFLQAAGLLVPDGPRRRLLSIPADLRPIVEQALAHRGTGSGGNG